MRAGYAIYQSFVAALFVGVSVSTARSEDAAGESPSLVRYRQDVKPLLEKFCYDCHGKGAHEGNRAFDVLEAKGEFLNDQKLWALVLKNVRSGMMPPEGEERPSADQVKRIADFAKTDVFQIDPQRPDPGRAVLRRLNRVEYQNTVRDLLGHEFDVLLHFPPDDTGYGFDTIGEVLMVSPMLTEKYLEAAERIVDAAVPKVTRKPAEKVLRGRDFVDALSAAQPQPEMRERGRSWPRTGEEIHFHETADLSAVFQAPDRGRYELNLELRVDGQFEYSPLRSNIHFFVDDEELIDKTLVYHDGESYHFRFTKNWDAGEHKLRFDVRALPAAEDAPRGRPDVAIRFKVIEARISGPTDRERWVKPANFDRIYSREAPPEGDEERLAYAREVLRKFATQAFRRPASDAMVEKLAQIAAREYQKPGKTFEGGIGRAMIAILASPRFLYRVEEHLPKADGEAYPLVDEYALASRLSYLLWSTMPDQELFKLAEAGQLRKQLDQQIDRMIADRRSRAFVENFAGQWLRARDVAHVRIDAGAVVAADMPPTPPTPPTPPPDAVADATEAQAAQAAQAEGQPRAGRQGRAGQQGRGRGRGRGQFGRGGSFVNFDGELRKAMQQETEMQFAHIMRGDRSLLELIDCDYAFLNQRLAEHYKIEGVVGPEMRLVKLEPESPRGGVLTQGSFLTITSNPDRTSPVKRGLFVLDNILGTPPPPPPAAVPELEESAGKFAGKKPTLREVLELHRENALCTACHARMDPLGLALENFNALGMWRTTDGQQPINAAGRLMSGEKFESIKELKKILKETKKRDFYYCVTEKMMTYALGRGVEFSDAHAVDQIVDKLDSDEGKFSVLLKGIVSSPQFQRRREPDSNSVAVKSAALNSAAVNSAAVAPTP